jgi:hypothetical protein
MEGQYIWEDSPVKSIATGKLSDNKGVTGKV